MNSKLFLVVGLASISALVLRRTDKLWIKMN
ncbi:hypothetical protein A5880_002869 [Enterococcus sp. 4G2_DIV0659]|uniref:Uncharacterized protein n=1 Tax=Candidatus Enterococcus mansonii TaxID=1834181 RepID=A0A242CIL2_9ENTE|nr:hypothetical protein A5880_000766 [Enterococcus sp. 4G2_DIV0659]